MLEIWSIKIFVHWIVIFDRLVKNFKKCLTYPSATKDERYKGRGNREKVDQTEGEIKSNKWMSYQQHGRRDGWQGNTCTLKTWRLICHLPRWIWGKLFKQARCKKLKFRVITNKKYIFAHKSQKSSQVMFSILQLIDVDYWPINRIYSIPH